MLTFRDLSIRRKQMVIIMLTSTVSLLLACAAFIAYDVSRFRREMVASLSSLAEVVGNNLTAAIDFNDPSSAIETLAALRGERNIVLAHVHTSDDWEFATYAREGVPPPPEIPYSPEARHEFTATHLHLFRPIALGGERIATIEIIADLNQLRERLWRYAGLAGLVLMASMLAAFGLSNRLQKVISDPILQLARVARSVAIEKDFTVRASKESRDELGELVDGFNEMLAQIQERDAALLAARDTLELAVEERTGELASTNQILQRENTERKRSEEQLRVQAAALDAAANAIVITDPQGTIQSVNAAFTALTGYTAQEAVGRNPRLLNSGQHDEAFFRGLWQTISSGRLWSGELTNRRKDGSLYTEEMTISSLRDVDGSIARYVAIKQDITERKRVQAELGIAHKQLVEASRRGGMAEIASNVLHNVGNVLNSVNVSAGLIVERVRKSRASSLARVVALLREHAHDLGAFISLDAKGKHVPAHLAQLSEHLLADQAAMIAELDSLRRNVEHIKEIVAMQQSYATFGGVKEMINVVDLVEDSLRMNEDALNRHSVEVIREFEAVPPLNVEKHKILQILVNLLRNAKHACQDSERADKRLTVRVASGGNRVRILLMDNGVGIAPENLNRIFNHGFTTRKGGHGFGLHSGALAAQELGGSLTVHSDGPGQGAAFTLELPLSAPKELL